MPAKRCARVWCRCGPPCSAACRCCGSARNSCATIGIGPSGASRCRDRLLRPRRPRDRYRQLADRQSRDARDPVATGGARRQRAVRPADGIPGRDGANPRLSRRHRRAVADRDRTGQAAADRRNVRAAAARGLDRGREAMAGLSIVDAGLRRRAMRITRSAGMPRAAGARTSCRSANSAGRSALSALTSIAPDARSAASAARRTTSANSPPSMAG